MPKAKTRTNSITTLIDELIQKKEVLYVSGGHQRLPALFMSENGLELLQPQFRAMNKNQNYEPQPVTRAYESLLLEGYPCRVELHDIKELAKQYGNPEKPEAAIQEINLLLRSMPKPEEKGHVRSKPLKSDSDGIRFRKNGQSGTIDWRNAISSETKKGRGHGE